MILREIHVFKETLENIRVDKMVIKLKHFNYKNIFSAEKRLNIRLINDLQNNWFRFQYKKLIEMSVSI